MVTKAIKLMLIESESYISFRLKADFFDSFLTSRNGEPC